MKVIRPRETVENVTPEELIRYALSLEHVTAAVIGTDSLEVLNQNIELVREFEKLDTQEMGRISRTLEPFYASSHIPWMQPGYTDGALA
jgi:hypothetical protein